VVFVWYRDTARLLAEALRQQRQRHDDAASSNLCETYDDEDNGGSEIRCGVITGDIVKQSVGSYLSYQQVVTQDKQ
jgi:hypothetical protein